MTVTDAMLAGWLQMYFWPFLRIGGLAMTAPLLNAQAVAPRIRLMLALALTLVLAPLLPRLPAMPLFGASWWLCIGHEFFIGAALGSTIRVCRREEAGASGVAMIAAVATGLYSNMMDCAEDWVKPYLDVAQAPDLALAERYEQLFPAYVEARLAARPVWKRLAAQRAGADHV